ncbi:Flagellar basal body L-ring protein [Ignavibacterium album JCM 16511]|uniref:Flagellar L-ring protein n=1 Tax=Ignavibacterium album (strain DSM 19864 / JCM 16511 / NBRC 101810 / Mat9-16) TaxID=945713 RepID=I0AMK9_IGNAJ|nr:flagellar basal body L-ring protein FlgH [Ignavibacterium album]AFH50216.1 Flagellar basal body L-ring protein [Ignavibacterium album JCM 16511]
MKKLFSIIVFITVAIFPQEMRKNAAYSLFSDEKAARVGDAITIIVVESSIASNNAETKSGRETNLSFDLSGQLDKTKLPSGSLDIGSGNDFKGSGSTKTSGVIQTKISATIDSVLANGNLIIRGSKKITINGEEQLISIKGIVRTSDVRADNSVLSYNISDAEITFEGNGIVSDVQSPGLLTKFLRMLF